MTEVLNNDWLVKQRAGMLREKLYVTGGIAHLFIERAMSVFFTKRVI